MEKSFKKYLSEARISPTAYNLPQLFDVLNHQLFGGELPRVPISFGKLPKGQVGVTVCNVQRVNGRSTFLLNTARIIITPRGFEEDVLKGIVAHEMVHLYLYSQHQNEAGHGIFFRTKLRDIQNRARFKIPTDHELNIDELEGLNSKECAALFIHKENGSVSFALYPTKLYNQMMGDVRKYAESVTTLNIHMQGGLAKKFEYGLLDSSLPNIFPVQRIPFGIKTIKVYALTPVQYTDLMKTAKFKPAFSIYRRG